ncbi:MAG: molecular chaperone Hsp33 [Bacteriovoracaceae bacterium]|jgi:molecular chaperone Hsp33
MKNTSRQYSFICNKNGFTISVIEGDSLIQEISKIHNIGPHALEYYRKTVLSSLQMVNFLKPGESLGFYIDSEDPFFRFKIELGNNGALRTLLLPEEFEDFPQNIQGKCRIHKIMQGKEPYTSVLNLEDQPVETIVNEVIEKSYQTRSKVLTSKDCSSSIMITKLPPSNVNKKVEDFDDLSMEQIQEQYSDLIQAALIIPNADVQIMDELFSAAGLMYIGSKEVKFDCPCSHQRMVENLFTLPEVDRHDIFKDGDTVETRCDYCNTIYEIKKDEILKPLH